MLTQCQQSRTMKKIMMQLTLRVPSQNDTQEDVLYEEMELVTQIVLDGSRVGVCAFSLCRVRIAHFVT